MKTSRLEAFSDGVMAIIITIMVLDLRVPLGHDLASLRRTSGTPLLTYLLSFMYVGIYWNNHHHMFQLVRRVTGAVLWANLGLLFSISLFPFTTAWMDESHLARTPVFIYGVNLLLAACAYFVLQSVIVREQGADSDLKRAVGKDVKGKGSMVLYLTGLACIVLIGGADRIGTWLGLAWFVLVAILWLVPDRRIERVIAEGEASD